MANDRVFLFSGGRGTYHLLRALHVQGINTVIGVNGYDAGLSTGRVRRSLPGLLGPSDYRKLTSTICSFNQKWSEFGQLLEDRDLLETVVGERDPAAALLRRVSQRYPNLPASQWLHAAEAMQVFLSTDEFQPSVFDYADIPLGNAVFAGMFINYGSDFNRAVDHFANAAHEASHGNFSILNITKGEDLWIVAESGGYLIADEGGLVTQEPPGQDINLFLVERDVAFELAGKFDSWTAASPAEINHVIGSSKHPLPNPEVHRVIQESEVIVLGTGTQSSSLRPSYLTQGITDAVRASQAGRRVMFVNGERDLDTSRSVDWSQSVLAVLKDFGVGADKASELLTDLVYLAEDVRESRSGWLTVDPQFFETLSSGVQLTEIDAREFTGQLSSKILESIMPSSVQLRQPPSEHRVSVIIPVRNEAPRLERILTEIENAEDFREFDLELIFVDGGSTDDSFELIRRIPYAKHLRVVTDGPRGGRFRAISEGLAHARGSCSVVMHSDGEYHFGDALRLARAARASNQCSVIFGSRQRNNRTSRALLSVYEGNAFLSLLSRLGGYTTSFILSFRIGRMIGDPFCGVFAARTDILRTITPTYGDIDGCVRLLMRAHRSSLDLEEIGVLYNPRSYRDGKSTRLRHGIRALYFAIREPSGHSRAQRRNS